MRRRRLVQSKTFWDDLKFPATGINPPGAAADPVVNSTNGLLEFSASATNTVAIQVQLPHDWKAGSIISPHVHWRKKTEGAGNVTWQLTYEFVDIGDTFTDSPTTLTSSTAVRGGGDTALVHSLTSFGDVSMTGLGISCMGILTVSRIGGDSNDTYAGVAQLLEFDIHYQRDSIGSIGEFTKSNVWHPVFRTTD